VAVNAQPFALPVAGAAKAPAAVAVVPEPVNVPVPAEILEAEFARGVEMGRAEAMDYYKQQYEQLKADLEQQAQDAREAARAEGHREGLARAEQEIAGRLEQEAKAAQAQLAKKAEALDHLIQGAERAAQQRSEEMEDDIVALCHGIVCRLLGEKVATPDGVLGMAREAMKYLHGKALTISVHPDDLELLVAVREELAPHAQWKADPALALGGMRIRGETESLDASLETQMAGLKKLLLEVRSRHKERH
jgi:flagellar assembly protein FliH